MPPRTVEVCGDAIFARSPSLRHVGIRLGQPLAMGKRTRKPRSWSVSYAVAGHARDNSHAPRKRRRAQQDQDGRSPGAL